MRGAGAALLRPSFLLICAAIHLHSLWTASVDNRIDNTCLKSSFSVSRYLLEALSCPSTRSNRTHKTFCRPYSSLSDAATDQEAPKDISTPIASSLEAGNALPANIRSSGSLKHSHVGQYYPIDETKIPEAFQQWYTNRDARASKTVPIEGGGAIKPLPSFVAGCSGLQHELAQTQYPYLMYR